MLQSVYGRLLIWSEQTSYAFRTEKSQATTWLFSFLFWLVINRTENK